MGNSSAPRKQKIRMLVLSDLRHTPKQKHQPCRHRKPPTRFYAIAPSHSTFTVPETLEHVCRSKQFLMFHAWYTKSNNEHQKGLASIIVFTMHADNTLPQLHHRAPTSPPAGKSTQNRRGIVKRTSVSSPKNTKIPKIS